jgi:hypothetical protein
MKKTLYICFQVSTSTVWINVMSFQVACNKTHKKEMKKGKEKETVTKPKNCSGDHFGLVIGIEYFCTIVCRCTILG